LTPDAPALVALIGSLLPNFSSAASGYHSRNRYVSPTVRLAASSLISLLSEWSINPLPRHPCPVDVELLAGHQSPVDVEQPDCKLRGMEMEWLAVAKVG
jgi:hypothetical protein